MERKSPSPAEEDEASSFPTEIVGLGCLSPNDEPRASLPLPNFLDVIENTDSSIFWDVIDNRNSQRVSGFGIVGDKDEGLLGSEFASPPLDPLFLFGPASPGDEMFCLEPRPVLSGVKRGRVEEEEHPRLCFTGATHKRARPLLNPVESNSLRYDILNVDTTEGSPFSYLTGL